MYVHSLSCSQAPRAVPQRVPLGRASVTLQPGPWLRPARAYSLYKARQTRQQDEATEQPRQPKSQQTKSGPICKSDEGLWRVCVCGWGRQALVLGHVSKLATSTAYKSNNKTGGADTPHKNKPTTTTRGQTKGQHTTHQNTERQRSGQKKPKNAQGRGRRPDGSVGMALVLPALTDSRWWFESLLVHSEVLSATRRKATGADKTNKDEGEDSR